MNKIISRIVSSKEVLAGKPCVDGTRVSAEQVYEMHTDKGIKLEEIAEALPTADLNGIKAAIEYIE